METYEYFQPEYVKKFKCDGQACNANCCRRGWIINIDKKTYKQYSHLKPKSAANEITRHFKKNDNDDNYTIKLDETGACPLLTENNLCKMQLKYGKEFLSETCVIYPRCILNVGSFYERSLTLTCPVAAKMILLETEPLKFEKIEVIETSEKIKNDYPILLDLSNQRLNELKEPIMSIQKTTISVLQERSLPIDRRLLMLGLYCDKLHELFETGWFDEVKKLQPVYQNSAFLQEQSEQFSAVTKFDAQSYIKMMLGLLETLYGEGNVQSPEDKKFLDAVINFLQLKIDESNNVKISELTKNYLSHSEERQNFLQRFSTIFENYLVNEWFLNLYPLKFNISTIFNYVAFVITYKMLELLTLSIFITAEHFEESELISAIGWYATNIDHDSDYMKKIEDYLKDKNDIIDIMKNMLQV